MNSERPNLLQDPISLAPMEDDGNVAVSEPRDAENEMSDRDQLVELIVGMLKDEQSIETFASMLLNIPIDSTDRIVDLLKRESRSGQSIAKNERKSRSILNQLKTLPRTSPKYHETIIEAESIAFEANEGMELCRYLREFIVGCTDRPTGRERFALCAAVRKYLFNIESDKMDDSAEPIQVGSKVNVSIDVELELIKTFNRRMIYDPTLAARDFPQLEAVWIEIARCYLHPRILGREKYGAIALNTALALILTGSKYQDELKNLLDKANASWLKKGLRQRLTAAMKELENRTDSQQSTELKDRISRFRVYTN